MLKIMQFAFVLMFPFLSLSVHAQQAPDTIPSFQRFVSYETDSIVVNSDNLPDSGYIVFNFYDAGCGHCQELGESIAKNFSSYAENSTFYFISMNAKEYVDGFINTYTPSLKNQKNVIFLHDRGTEFFERFDPSHYPSTYIYDAKTRKLIHYFAGETNAKKFIPYLK
ncbi:peroxiredoxin family protein [Sphingobacterium hungaricum]|nr:redoxin domain-containing protein [Sphingobacterium hungaricum]